MKSMMSCVEVPGRKISAMPAFFSGGNISFGNDAADEHSHVVHAFGLQQVHQLRADGVVRAGKNGQADDVHIFLNGGGSNHFRSLPQAGVDHFHAGVAQGARDDLGAAVVAVETGLGDQNANFLGSGIGSG